MSEFNPELSQALIRELCSGRRLMESMANQREMDAAREAEELRKQQSKNWKPLAVIPQHEFFTLGHKYGMDCWKDRGFVRDFQKTQSHLKVHQA